MKKYTYTNMRTELSDILDILRSGESVTITQRGKPDVVLQGFPASQVNDNLHNEDELVIETSKTPERTSVTPSVQPWSALPSGLEKSMKLISSLPHSLEKYIKLKPSLSPGLEKSIKLIQSSGLKETQSIAESIGFKQIWDIADMPVFKRAAKSIAETQKLKPNLPPEFLRALLITQIKYADVIKKLEDK